MENEKRWSFAVSLILKILFAMVSNCSSPPHIIFIVVDDVGWNDVGWHNSQIKTPNLNFLVRKGVEINNSYVSPVCSPSRVALLTGRYPFKLGLQKGVINNDRPHGLPLTATLLPEVLKKFGYSTHAVGKWHLGFCNWSYTPTFRGFDSFYGFYTGHEDHFTHSDARGYDFRLNEDIHLTKEYSTMAYTKRVENIIRRHDSQTPLFIYLAFQAAHPPLQVPPEFLKKYRFVKAKRRKVFSAMITAVDQGVGRIIKVLKSRDMIENTIFAFVSDNGASQENGGSNWPLKGGKATLWEGGTRVPSFISGFELPAKKLQGLFHAVDWFPTLIDAASRNGLTNNMNCCVGEIDGISHWTSLLNRHKTTTRKSFVYQINSVNGIAALRSGRFKIIEGCAGHHDEKISVPKTWREENEIQKKLKQLRIIKSSLRNCSRSFKLYDLQEDECENKDLSSSPLHSKMFSELKAELNEFRLEEVAPFHPRRTTKAFPNFWGGFWSPGWC